MPLKMWCDTISILPKAFGRWDSSKSVIRRVFPAAVAIALAACATHDPGTSTPQRGRGVEDAGSWQARPRLPSWGRCAPLKRSTAKVTDVPQNR
jgi:hypothetical protein